MSIRGRSLRAALPCCALIATFFNCHGLRAGESTTLYAAEARDRNTRVFTVDPTSAAATLVGDAGVEITGLAIHPTTGVLYGSTSESDSEARRLVSVDPNTGAATIVGLFGTEKTMADLSFDPTTGILYGWMAGPSGDLHIIDLATGAATKVGESGLSDLSGNGLAFDASGRLFFAGERASGPLRLVDKATGLTTVLLDLDGPDRPIGALAFDGDSLYAVIDSQLATISLPVCIVTIIGAIHDGEHEETFVDAIAFTPRREAECELRYRLRCPTNPDGRLHRIRAGEEVSFTLEMLVTGEGDVTFHALSAIVSTSDPHVALGPATILGTVFPDERGFSIADIVPENRVYNLGSRGQATTFSLFFQNSSGLVVPRGEWIAVAEIPVDVDLDHRTGDVELCLDDITGFQGFVGERSRFNEAVIDCAADPTVPVPAIAVDRTETPAILNGENGEGSNCYSCPVIAPLYKVELKSLTKSCRLDDDGCPDPADGVSCVDLTWCIRDWKQFLANTNPKRGLFLKRSNWLCEGTKGGSNCDGNEETQGCYPCPEGGFACRKCLNPCSLETSLTSQEINDLAVANLGDPCEDERLRPQSEEAALAIAEDEFCLKVDHQDCSNNGHGEEGLGHGKRWSVHPDAIRSFCTAGGRFSVHFALAAGPEGREDMFFWIRDCDTVDLPYDSCSEAGLCYEIGVLDRTNDDRDPLVLVFSRPAQVLLRRLAVEEVHVGVGSSDVRTQPDVGWINYYMDIHDVTPVSSPSGTLTGFEVRGSGFGESTKIAICVRHVPLSEPCCCDDDNTFENRAGIPHELNWTYIFDGGTQCICTTKGTELVRRSDTRLLDCTRLRVFIPRDTSGLRLLPARPPCPGVFEAKVFVVDEQVKQCTREGDEFHCPLEIPLPRPTPGSQCQGNSDCEIFCASPPVPLNYGFSRPDFEYSRSGPDKFELYDVFAILFYIFGEFERPFNEPLCLDAGDANDSGSFDLGDPVTALHMLFNSGFTASPPAWPNLGFDPSADSLHCGFTGDAARLAPPAEDCFGCPRKGI